MEWWDLIDQKYFISLTLKDVMNKRDWSTSNNVLTINSCESLGATNYKDRMINSMYPSMKEK